MTLRIKQKSLHLCLRIGILSFCTSLLFLVSSGTVQAQKAKPRVQTARVNITQQGFTPYNIRLRRGVSTRLIFLRNTDATCATEVLIADFGIRRSLPLNLPVTIAFTPKKSGEVSFTCGMNMMRGTLVVQ